MTTTTKKEEVTEMLLLRWYNLAVLREVAESGGWSGRKHDVLSPAKLRAEEDALREETRALVVPVQVPRRAPR